MNIWCLFIVLILTSTVINGNPITVFNRKLRTPYHQRHSFGEKVDIFKPRRPEFNLKRLLSLKQAERLKLDLEIIATFGKAMLVLPMIFGVGSGTIVSTLFG